MITISINQNDVLIDKKGRYVIDNVKNYNDAAAFDTIYVSAAAGPLATGDQLVVWDTLSDTFVISMEGYIQKPSGKKVYLEGCRDVGIRTGHPPYMGLKKLRKFGVVWQYDPSVSTNITVAPWGQWYVVPPLELGWYDDDHNKLIAKGFEPIEPMSEITMISKGTRLRVKWEDSLPIHKGWKIGYVLTEHKMVQLIPVAQRVL